MDTNLLKKNLTDLVKLVALALIFGVAASYAFAAPVGSSDGSSSN